MSENIKMFLDCLYDPLVNRPSYIWFKHKDNYKISILLDVHKKQLKFFLMITIKKLLYTERLSKKKIKNC